MAKRTRIGIIFGGKSAEHEVSLQSAKSIIEAIDKDKFEPVPICIARTGEWYIGDGAEALQQAEDTRSIHLNLANDENNTVNLITGERYGQLVRARTHEKIRHIDVYFPVLHGPMGEDGTIQGLLKLANVPFVGASVLGSAIGMDKDVMKRLLRDGRIPTCRFLTFSRFEQDQITFDLVRRELGAPFFVKPCNMGSSVGVTKVHNESELAPALHEAFRFDHKLIIEESIKGREIECSVLGNQDPVASVPGEIVVQPDFYSYDAKYLDSDAADLRIPADLKPEIAASIRSYAVDAFKVLACEGMARVDFFLRGDEIFVNEINTIPGFTRISMYPKLWEASGLSYPELIERLIELAQERYERDQLLRTTRD